MLRVRATKMLLGYDEITAPYIRFVISSSLLMILILRFSFLHPQRHAIPNVLVCSLLLNTPGFLHSFYVPRASSN